VLGSLKVAVGFAFTGACVGYNAGLTMGLIFLIMAFVLLLFFCAEWIERRLLRWRPRGAVKTAASSCSASRRASLL
jgi:NitT/TauT family transport system permease protein